MDYQALPVTLLPWADEFKIQVGLLIKAVSRYLNKSDVLKIEEACLYGAIAHQHQTRSSGEPYIFHPLAVAQILTEVQLDCESIIGAILHDVIEDTDINFKEIADTFGYEVAEIVDGVSKLTQIKFGSKEEAKAENFRKMIMAMTKDIRVIMVKLADRLHNMRTLGALAAYKKRRIAHDTLDIYAPIASRLGMYVLQSQLENLCFENLYPWRYKVLKHTIDARHKYHLDILDTMKDRLQVRLEQHQISVRLSTREKHLWGIYKKLKEKGSIEEIFDIFAIRVLVRTVDECYRTLGITHGLFKPIIGKFKDYIAIPKANGYQSLHTIVLGERALPVELQIRTRDMHVVAEAGAAAHWRYKDQYAGLSHNRDRTSEWLKTMKDMQVGANTSEEFMESVKQDLSHGAIYVFTPKGKIIELPRDATPVDFAYSIHSDIGNTCVSAKINRVIVSLKTPLKNGQTVEISTSIGMKPNPIWLNFVKTSKARSAIRQYLNHLHYDEAVMIGKKLIEQSLATKNIKLEGAYYPALNALALSMSFTSLDDLLAQIGFGKHPASLVVTRLLSTEIENEEHYVPAAIKIKDTIYIKDGQDLDIGFGKCCQPLPGDQIMGFLSIDKGLIVHRTSCKHIPTYKKNLERWIDVAWDKKVSGDFPVDICLVVIDRRGSWASIAACMAELDVNMGSIETKVIDSNVAEINIMLRVKSRSHLAQIFVHLRRINVVKKVIRNK